MTADKLPALSVALSVHNGARFLGAAIESILGQTYTNYEFLILDDGSSDSSGEIIEEYAKLDSRIHAMHQPNCGLVASLNRLLVTARAPLIARMDADDLALPNRFALQVAFLEAHHDYGVIGGATEDIDEHDRPWACHALPYVASHDAFLERIASGGPLLCHPAVMYRRDVVLAVGGYHAAFKHCEDLDLWLRLASVTKLGNLPEPLINYRHYADQVSSRHATEQQIGAAVARLAWAERAAGRSDPTADLAELPPLDAIDVLFGRAGLARKIRASVVRNTLYARSSLLGDGFNLILHHVAEDDDTSHAGHDADMRRHLWRTVMRLLRFGAPSRAFRLAVALIAS